MTYHKVLIHQGQQTTTTIILKWQITPIVSIYTTITFRLTRKGKETEKALTYLNVVPILPNYY